MPITRRKVAEALHAPLDLLLVRKIGVPFQPELAMGAVVDGASPLTVRNEEVISLAGISEREFSTVCNQQLAEIERRRKMYALWCVLWSRNYEWRAPRSSPPGRRGAGPGFGEGAVVRCSTGDLF
jgi:hypothetical protein